MRSPAPRSVCRCHRHTPLLRRVWCRLRRRHRLVAVVGSETVVQVVCRHCLASEEVPIAVPAVGESNGSPLTIPAVGSGTGVVRVGAAEVEDQMQRLAVLAEEMRAAYERVAAELQEARADLGAARLIESAFVRRWEP